MAADDWDPFSDPAQGAADGVKALRAVSSKAPVRQEEAAKEAPLNPWDDEIFVEMAVEAGKLAEAARQEALRWQAEREEQDRKEAEQKEAERLEALKDPEGYARKVEMRRICFQEAMEAIRAAPAFAAMKRAQASSEAPVNEDGAEVAPKCPAAEIVGADQRIQVSVKASQASKAASTGPVGLLFPDQSSKGLRLLSGLLDLPEVQRLRESAQDILGWDPLEGPGYQGLYELLKGPEGFLEHVEFLQPAMYVSQVASVERLRSRAPGALRRVQAVAGLSLGAYAALTFAEVWAFETGLRVVQLRAQAMQEVLMTLPQQAIAVAGLEKEILQRLCKQSCTEEGDVCTVAQHLFPKGFTCAGTQQAVKRLLEVARRTEGCLQVMAMKPASACHTSLMEPVRSRLCELLSGLEAGGALSPPKCAVWIGLGATKIAAGAPPRDVVDALLEELTEPVQWENSIRALLKEGIEVFYECGPLQQLKGVMKRIDQAAFEATHPVDIFSVGPELVPGARRPPRWAAGDLPAENPTRGGPGDAASIAEGSSKIQVEVLD